VSDPRVGKLFDLHKDPKYPGLISRTPHPLVHPTFPGVFPVPLTFSQRRSKIAKDLGIEVSDPRVGKLFDHKDPKYPGTLEYTPDELLQKIQDAMDIGSNGDHKNLTPQQKRTHPLRRQVSLVRGYFC
jgi:hypothetical protein